MDSCIKNLTDEEIDQLILAIKRQKEEILYKYCKITVSSFEEKTSSCNAGHQELGYEYVEECDEKGLYDIEKELENIKKTRN